MALDRTVSLSGRSITLREFREFVNALDGSPDDTEITVYVSKTSSSLTDPGGDIYISATKQ